MAIITCQPAAELHRLNVHRVWAEGEEVQIKLSMIGCLPWQESPSDAAPYATGIQVTSHNSQFMRAHLSSFLENLSVIRIIRGARLEEISSKPYLEFLEEVPVSETISQ